MTRPKLSKDQISLTFLNSHKDSRTNSRPDISFKFQNRFSTTMMSSSGPEWLDQEGYL